MITNEIIIFLSCLAFLLLVTYFVHLEHKRGQRFFASAFRDSLDNLVTKLSIKLLNIWNNFSKYVLQLGWYYGLHSFLKAILKVIVSIYTYFENLFEVNRTRAKRLRAEKRELSELNHLKQISEHRADTALSEAEKNKLKDKHLEGRH